MNAVPFEAMDLRRLPRRIGDLVDAMGWTPTLRLLGCFGGSSVYVPKKAASGSRLHAVLGDDALAKLAAVYPGETVELPKIDHVQRQMRDLQIVSDLRRGCSSGALAEKYGLTRRQITNIKRTYADYPGIPASTPFVAASR